MESANVALMGEELGKIYSALWQEVAAVYFTWGEYQALFGGNPGRVDLLNKAAPSFFRLAQDTLFENVVLHIARITDSPITMGKANLTVRRLPALISDPDLRPLVEKCIESTEDKVSFCRDWRNRHLAHRDLSLAVSSPAEQLQPATRASVNEALASVAEILNTVSLHYKDGSTHFGFPSSMGGSVSLLEILEKGVRATEEEFDRLFGQRS